MSYSGDAAEQVVKMTLDGAEVAARITGSAAKEIIMFLIAALKKGDNGNMKLKGKERLTTMLKSGKALEIISIRDRDLAKFAKGAKEYGIVYCALRNTKNSPDGLCDVMVKADDAPKISRLVERYNFATVDRAKIESRTITEKPEKETGAKAERAKTAGTGPEPPHADGTEKLLDDLLGKKDGKAASDKPETGKNGPAIPEPAKTGRGQADGHPLAGGGTGKSNPSVPILESRKKPERATSSKPSVKEEMRELKAARKQKEAEPPKRGKRVAADKTKAGQATMHKQPQRGKPKPTKSKGCR